MLSPSDDPLSRLAVVVVNFGSHELVETNLTRSLGPAFPGRVVVVDNWTSERERRSMEVVCDVRGWTFVPMSSNRGFGGGCNRGAEVAAQGNAFSLLFLNPDAWIDLDAIRRLHEQVVEDPRLLVAPRVLRPDGGLFSEANDVYLDHGEMRWRALRAEGVLVDRVHTWVSGACFMVSVALWEDCGGFDEDYFLYWEDVDLARRVTRADGRLRVDGSAHAVHDEGSTHTSASPAGLKSPTYFYYNARNRLVYAAKHLTVADQVRWVRATPRASYRLALQGGRRQFLHPSRNLWPVIRGTWDGLRHLGHPRRRVVPQPRSSGVRS